MKLSVSGQLLHVLTELQLWTYSDVLPPVLQPAMLALKVWFQSTFSNPNHVLKTWIRIETSLTTRFMTFGLLLHWTYFPVKD